jgi:hypothetical protein
VLCCHALAGFHLTNRCNRTYFHCVQSFWPQMRERWPFNPSFRHRGHQSFPLCHLIAALRHPSQSTTLIVGFPSHLHPCSLSFGVHERSKSRSGTTTTAVLMRYSEPRWIAVVHQMRIRWPRAGGWRSRITSSATDFVHDAKGANERRCRFL